MKFEKQMYIDGVLCGEVNTDVISPATGEVVGRVAFGDANSAKTALTSAQKAAPAWVSLGVQGRSDWMHRLRDAVAKREEHLRLCVHLEVGKPWAATEEDFTSLVNSLSYYAEQIARFKPAPMPDQGSDFEHTLDWQPVGVVAAFIAWNFPLLNLAFKLGPAMAAGCPLILKPSFKSPLAAYAVGEICAEIGMPSGAVNIVCGDDAQVGDTLSASTIPALLTLIGSARTGRRLMQQGASSIKRFSMELGGNAPVLVFDDADLDLAAEIICALKFGNAGQICVTPNRILAQRSVYPELCDKIAARAAQTTVGFAREQDFDMGPLIDAAAWKRVDELVQDSLSHGAKLLQGGKRPEHLSQGHFYSPTVLRDVTPDMRISHEEIFGPVVPIMPFDAQSDALSLANDTDTGLTAYIFTRDQARAQDCAQALEFGEIQINGVRYDIALPHGGIKQSGVGVDCSYLALHDYLAPKRISRAA